MASIQQAQIVVIGGGAVGCGVAHSLCQAGLTDLLLVEKEPTLASQTTSQAAGLVGQVRSSLERTQLAMWSVQAFSELESHADARPGWRQVGSLRVALTLERVQEFKGMKAIADEAGLAVDFISNHQAQDMWPMFDFSAARAILWCPSDGYLQPNDLAMAYQWQSRRLGARFATGVTVTGLQIDRGRVTGVHTDQGPIQCETVINAAGAHAWHIAKMAGLDLPIFPVRHEYFVSVDAPGFAPSQPVMRVPDATLYLRPEINSLLLGGWEPAALSLAPDSFANAQTPPAISEDWEVLGAFAEQLSPLYPRATELGIRGVFKGWPTFVPDGRFIIGRSCRVQGFIMAGGCNAHGVSGSAGIGRHVMESILEASPSPYVKSLSPDRFTEAKWDPAAARAQAQHVYETYYAVGH